MNAIARRAFGTGTVSYHRATNTWRIRTPGVDGVQYSGFPTREAAIAGLEDAERGVTPRKRSRRRQHALTMLRMTLRYALALARMEQVDLDKELAVMRGTKKESE